LRFKKEFGIIENNQEWWIWRIGSDDPPSNRLNTNTVLPPTRQGRISPEIILGNNFFVFTSLLGRFFYGEKHMSRTLDTGRRTGTASGFDRKAHVDPAEAYARKWAVNGGAGLYTERSGAAETPLLRALVDRVAARPGPRTVVEAAAGSGDQALYVARALPDTNVVAIDTSHHATDQIRKRAQQEREQLGRGSEITVVTGDVLDDLHRRAQQGEKIDGMHANSFWHFLTSEQRRAQLDALHETVAPGGSVGVSFKAEGDGLLTEPGTIIVGRDDLGTHAIPKDGIQRVFIGNPAAIAAEFEAVGFGVDATIPFEIPDYDVPGKPGRFVGVLATTPV
jgi:Methyltransferase domain